MQGVGGTRQSGQTRGAVGITPTGIELGIDIGIGQLGISTDYGGGIVVGIFGQKIVWGREGGTIRYNLGGFEVIVEARDCVVVETRIIAGQVVASHTYPDPGCKLPEPEPNPNSNLPRPAPTPEDPNAIELPNTDAIGWVPFSESIQGYIGYLKEGITLTGSWLISRKATNVDSAANRRAFALPYTSVLISNAQNIFYQEPVVNKSSILTNSLYSVRKFGISNNDTISYPMLVKYNSINGVSTKVCFYGAAKAIKKFISDYNAEMNKYKAALSGPDAISGLTHVYIIQLSATGFIPLKETPFIRLPSAGNQPPMPESCCESLKADIEDIKEVLATKEILAGKMTFPWKWRMPGGEGEETIYDYPNLLRAMSQMIDHLGIHPPKLSVKDINNAIAGDQGLNNQFPSATQAFEALMTQIWDANADVDTLTNFLYRLAWLNVQQSMNMAVLSGKVQAISDMLGGETEPGESEITTPFNIGAGVKQKSTKGQGFGKNQIADAINNKIDANTEIATESLLPEFLKIRKNPITTERFSGGADLNDKIDMIILKLESLQRG